MYRIRVVCMHIRHRRIQPVDLRIRSFKFQITEHVIERAVLHHHNNNMTKRIEARWRHVTRITLNREFFCALHNIWVSPHCRASGRFDSAMAKVQNVGVV